MSDLAALVTQFVRSISANGIDIYNEFILATPMGSRVMRCEYGSLVPELLDHPLNGATVVRLYGGVYG